MTAVGKVALGDVEISEDRQHIWTINLADRKLYKIEVGDGSTHTVGDGRERVAYDILGDDANAPTNSGIPLGELGTDATNNARPFGLGIKDGLVYVGLVNSAQSTGDVNDLQAYVYSFDPENPNAGFTQALNFPLNYDRELKNPGVNAPAEWTPWVTTYDEFDTVAGTPINTQPILSDITFDNNGDMIVGLRDRTGDQAGLQSQPTDSNAPLVQVQTSGEILKAPLKEDGSGWEIEDSVTNSDPTIEFYDDDFSTNSGRIQFNNQFFPFSGAHDESAQGSVVQIPGYESVETTAMDPVDTALSGGILGLNNANGAKTRGIELYVSNFSNTDPNFSKANGLGDLEYAGDLAPIEIGNRIWNDLDNDGIQDPAEVGIEGVTVRLYDANDNLVAETITDAKGEYYFNNANVNQNGATGLVPFSDYQIRLDNTADFADGGVLNNFDLTVDNANGNGDDAIDSDAVNVTDTPTIAVTTGDYGANDYSNDAGFHKEIQPKDITLVGWIDFNRDGIFSEDEAVTLDTDNGLVVDGATPNTLEFSVPENIAKGPTAARFRVATGLTGDNLDATTSTGAAPNGEVEDYVVNLVPLHKLSGTVFSDTQNEAANAIDLPDNTDPDAPIPGDAPIAGVTVELFANDGSGIPAGEPLQSVVTDENGFYEFTDLLNGNYIVIESQPSGFDSVTDIDGTDDNKILATVADEDNTGNDFLEEIPTDYGDAPDTLPGSAAAPDENTPPDYQTTFADGGASHELNEESPVTIGPEVDSDDGTAQNPTATADDTDADGNDADGVFLAGTNTGLDGQDAVAAEGGNYSIDVIVHDGFTPIPTGAATTVTGTVFNDFDNDGTQELGNPDSEVGLEGITVTAHNNAGDVVGTATTDVDGAYTLNNPNGEALKLEFSDLPADFVPSSSGAVADAIAPVAFIDGTANTTANLGL
ncbi:MAG: SdrD B-like domain-containing protein, partial [Cyanobacteria bacterium J06631_2]